MAFILLILALSFLHFAQSVVFTASGEEWYVTAGGALVRPGQDYRVVAYLSRPLTLRATITRDDEQVVSSTSFIPKSSLTFLILQIPKSARQGNYKLQIDGKSLTSSLVFRNTTNLTFTPDFLSITVQTNRPVFTSGQTVHARIVLLQTDMKPFYDAVDIFLMDPDGFIMRRWLSIYSHNGVARISYQLPILTKNGYWKIRIKVFGQIHEENIKIETYYRPLFEVFVECPSSILDTEEVIPCTIYGMFPTEKYARGNITVEAKSIDLKNRINDIILWSNRTLHENGKELFEIPMKVIQSRLNRVEGQVIEISANIRDLFYGITRHGYCRTRIIARKISLKFLSRAPTSFRPGLPFHSYIAVNYEEGEPVPEEVLSESTLRIELRSDAGTDAFIVEGSKLISSEDASIGPIAMSLLNWPSTGVLGFEVMPPPNSERLTLEAVYSEPSGKQQTARLPAISHRSPQKRYITITSSTDEPVIREYAVFHVRTNFAIDSFHYLLLTKGTIFNGDTVKVSDIQPTTTSFALPLSADMSPGIQILVFHVTRDGELVSNSLYLPINSLGSYKTGLEMNMGKDSSGNMVEVWIDGDAGSFIGVQAMRSVAYKLQAGNELTEARVIDSFVNLDSVNRTFNRVLHSSKDGSSPDRVTYYSEMDSGVTAQKTFNRSGVHLVAIGLQNPPYDGCPEHSCFSQGCFNSSQMCDGTADCVDSSDEANCPESREDNKEFRLNRISRSFFLFDVDYGDWGRGEVLANDGSGQEQIQMKPPFVDDEWYFTSFTISQELGFSIVPEPVVYSSRRLFTAVLDGPPSCRRGEQISLQITLTNHDITQSIVLIQLMSSPDYKFVHVEPGGIVSSYGARLTSGEHQLLIYLGPKAQEHIDYPIAPTVEHGDIEIKLIASTQSAGASLHHKLKVIPEGGIVRRHTPVLLDLKNRAFVLSYLDIVVEETPIVPYQEWRRYVYGSPTSKVSVTGDMIGPAIPQMPLSKMSLLYTYGKGTDSRLFEFGMNILTLHYLRVTSQITPELLYKQLAQSTTLLSQVMMRFNPQGWFSNWDHSEPSIWLTAWVLRILRQAVYADWENILYIDKEIFVKATEWMINHQTFQGGFIEPSVLSPSIDSKIQLNETDIGLTAHVLIALSECLDVLEGAARMPVLHAKSLAIRYLETRLYSLKDTYQLALTAYALTVADSNERDIAYRKLFASSRISIDGYEYWSWKEVKAGEIKLENQRPFVKPRLYQEGDSEAVEATSYALLVILAKNGVTSLSDRIVAWLQTMRTTHLAFVSTTDTLVATQALTEYANRARLFDITKLDVSLRVSSNPEFKPSFHVSNRSATHSLTKDIPLVWGHVSAVARGAGLALLQLQVDYGVDFEPLTDHPSQPNFDLKIREIYSVFRNKSAITIESCTRWVREWPETSGAAVLEVEIPTGYNLLEDEASRLAYDLPYLEDAMTRPSKTLWFFSHVPKEWVCFNHTVNRWYPVANMTFYRQAMIYELTARERFQQVLVNSTPLYLLNICEVCGSYQCPYCPYYNGAIYLQLSAYLLTASFIVILLSR